ncbi:hypothetical protein J7554_09125 [Wohlfahrtiimonas chitiniclastica]|uniref:hypothetical protein n=1 Tax=Wohlfahrtiimonas chitiniclastica TaxID=400946 RepID=UPI001BCD2D0C|nr:hypothetical protein [Wohlfahrtiimonas chitiniclastica]MBS7829284.1 hypothetical protein [Wohlfahrtiimonas chitiniclastica]
MNQGKIKFHNKNFLSCIVIWLIFGFTVGTLLSLWVDSSFIKIISFVDPSLFKNTNRYYATMVCLVISSPFAFSYMYKHCLLEIILDGYFYYLFWLILIIGIFWNLGIIKLSVENSQDIYKSTILFRVIIYKFDWVGAVFVSFLGMYATVISGAVLLKYHQLKRKR